MLTLGQWKAGLETHDIDRMVETYSEDYAEWPFGDKIGVHEFFSNAAERGLLKNAEVSLDKVKLTIKGRNATAWPVFFRSSLGLRTFEIALTCEQGAWRITSVGPF